MPLRTAPPRLKPGNSYRVAPPPKTADHELLTPEHSAWRKVVLKRASYRCEWVERGQRCSRKAADGWRMVADHKVERADGGALYDPANGQCLCVKHNTLKGLQARGARI